MRFAFFCVVAFLLCLPSARAQDRSMPRPPGLKQAEEAERKVPLEPPLPPVRRQADPAQLKRQADELARLAQAIPAKVDQVTKGRLPRDLAENLKRIEKLAKQLRVQISP